MNRLLTLFRKMWLKYDIVFIAGRGASMIPLMIASHQMTSSDALDAFSKQYHVALFFSGIVLFGAQDIFLFKKGAQSRYYFHTILFNFLITTAVAYFMSIRGMIDFSLWMFVSFLFIRAYFIYYATLFRDSFVYTFSLVAALILSLGLIVMIGFNPIAMIPLVIITLWLGYINHAFTARTIKNSLRYYPFTLKFGGPYYANILLQQAFTQSLLFVYTYYASGDKYQTAIHIIYIFNLCQIPMSVVFRSVVAKIGNMPIARSDENTEARRSFMRSVIWKTILLSIAMYSIIYVLMEWIEKFLFGSVLIDDVNLRLFGIMVLLNSLLMVLSGVLTGVRRPIEQLLINVMANITILGGLHVLNMLGSRNDIVLAMIFGMMVQMLLRSWRISVHLKG